MYRFFVLNSHPIQYFAPQYRRLAQEPNIDLTVLYCSRRGLDSYQDKGFGGITVEWDIPLLDGYRSVFLENWVDRDACSGFSSLINPSIVTTLARERPDALLVHGYGYLTDLMAIAAANALNIPVLMRGDSNPLDARYQASGLKSKLRWIVREYMFEHVSGFLAIGTMNREFYLRHGVPSNKIFSVPFAVDNDRFRSPVLDSQAKADFRKAEGLHPDLPIVLFASKMHERKRAIDLVRAYQQLRQQKRSCQLVMVGDGNRRASLESYVNQHAIPDVCFPGFRNQSELPYWFSVAQAFVLPSENEPWGLVVNEAMAAGVPAIVSSDVGAAYDLVEQGDTGYVFPTGDIDSLERVLAATLADPSSSRAMGKAAAQRMTHWGNDEAVEGISRALEATTTTST